MHTIKFIGIVGSRRRNSAEDYLLVLEAFLKIYKPWDIIVSGGCPKGADNFAEQIATAYKISIVIHRAEWDKYGKAAGFKRNTYIAQDADVLIACVASDRKGGTEDTIKKYVKLGKKELLLV